MNHNVFFSLLLIKKRKKTEIVCFYNIMKCALDLLDIKHTVYTSNRKTKCCRMAVFFRLINIASVNVFIIYMCYNDTKMMISLQFTKEIDKALFEPYLTRRIAMSNFCCDIKENTWRRKIKV